jgi:hypothetical protein
MKIRVFINYTKFVVSDFHSTCDGIANTLTIIKAKSGNIFGGFTEKVWH